MGVLQFTPFTSLVEPGFWHALSALKIDVLQLSDATHSLHGTYTTGRVARDRKTGQDIPLRSVLSLGADALCGRGQDETTRTISDGSDNGALHKPSQPMCIAAQGVIKNYNTIEEFKAAHKVALFSDLTDEMWRSIEQDHDTSKLTRFLLITFADLKKYRFYYWFAFPAFVAQPAWDITDEGLQNVETALTPSQISTILTTLRANTLPFFLVLLTDGSTAEVYPLDGTANALFTRARSDSTQLLVGFLDPSAEPANPGWPLRNLLAYLSKVYPTHTSSLRILCWRDTECPPVDSPWRSRVGRVMCRHHVPVDAKPSAVGWEKDPTTNKLTPRIADLAPMMDPARLADQAVDLNLKLMRWRIAPNLDLDRVARTRCLLLGAGTLGCYVARALMGWGVRTITFVDSARVSFSNPVRQPLFEFADSLDGGKPKAACAAESLRKIFPGVNATGHTLSIPMPGHSIPSSSVDATRADVAQLARLVDEHDVLFLLMDSRESRWLPTVLGAANGKIVLNAALGFDTYVVMRHGARAAASPSPSSTHVSQRLGCYYCNDIVAPTDSLTERTLDQMCTVSRPGLAPIAAATAVELLVSLLQHPDGIHAPPPPPSSISAVVGQAPDTLDASRSTGVLGLVPHQLRGFLAQFRTLPIIGAAFEQCTGCSELVLRAYEQEGFEMVQRACDQPGYLEALTGLDKLHRDGEAILESVEWNEEEEAEGGLE